MCLEALLIPGLVGQASLTTEVWSTMRTVHWLIVSHIHTHVQTEEGEITIDDGILAAIKVVVREEMGVISARLDSIDKTLANLVELQQRILEVEEGLQFTSERLNTLATEVLPAMCDHMARITESLAHQTLQIDVHRRKWNIVIHGIEGPVGELECATRAKCIQFAKEVLQVEDAATWHLAACHRLSQKPNAGIILRFVDLAQRDRWLTGTKHLRGYTRKISISPDLPPFYALWKTRWCWHVAN